jgi:hypothetical protein
MSVKSARKKVQLSLPIQEFYKSAPPVNAKGVVENLLLAVPSEYLTGLECIILCDVPSFKEHYGQEEKISDARYIRCRNGTNPVIEICVDKLVEGYEGFPLKLSIVRDFLLSEVLYHEIGHHIHRTSKNNIGSEAEAEKWRKIFQERYLLKRHWLILIPLLIFSKLFKRRISKWRQSLEINCD